MSEWRQGWYSEAINWSVRHRKNMIDIAQRRNKKKDEGDGSE